MRDFVTFTDVLSAKDYNRNRIINVGFLSYAHRLDENVVIDISTTKIQDRLRRLLQLKATSKL